MLPESPVGGEDPGTEEVDDLADFLDTPLFLTRELEGVFLEWCVRLSTVIIHTYQSSNLVAKTHLMFSGSFVITSCLCSLSSTYVAPSSSWRSWKNSRSLLLFFALTTVYMLKIPKGPVPVKFDVAG
jgi:hypothetical protein